MSSPSDEGRVFRVYCDDLVELWFHGGSTTMAYRSRRNIATIKWVRTLTGKSLSDAKQFVEADGWRFLAHVPQHLADFYVETFAGFGYLVAPPLYLELDVAIRRHCAEPTAITQEWVGIKRPHPKWRFGQQAVEVERPTLSDRFRPNFIIIYHRHADDAGAPHWDDLVTTDLDVVGESVARLLEMRVEDEDAFSAQLRYSCADCTPQQTALFRDLDRAVHAHKSEDADIRPAFSRGQPPRWICGNRAVEVFPEAGTRVVVKFWPRAEGAAGRAFLEHECGTDAETLDVLGDAIAYFLSFEAPPLGDDDEDELRRGGDSEARSDLDILFTFHLRFFGV